MCKCCQHCLESCYWHCCEKWFCYDESIALWEDPDLNTRNQIGWDNMAYWDSIAVIANRNVVTIQPLAESKTLPEITTTASPPGTDLTDQLMLQDDLHRRLSEVFKRSSVINTTSINIDENDEKTDNNQPPKFTICDDSSPTHDNTTNQLKEANSLQLINKSIDENVHKSAEHIPTKLVSNRSFDRPREPFNTSNPILMKKPTELRLIKQNSMPNFYIETPEINEKPPLPPDKILTSPVLPNTPEFRYDLRSIVQMEMKKSSTSLEDGSGGGGSGASNCETNEGRSKRLAHLRKRLAPLIIKKPSLRNMTLKHNAEMQHNPS